MKHFNYRHPLVFFFVLVLVLGTVAATNFGTLAPTSDNTFDLGEASNEWRNLYIDGHAYLDSATITSVTTPFDNINISTGISSPLTPTADDSYTLGTPAKRWESLSVVGVASGLTPTSGNNFDLGATGSSWKDLYVTGVAVGLTPTSNDNFDLGASGSNWRDLYVTGVAVGLTPTTSNHFDLGAVGTQWKDAYIDGTAYVDDLDVGSSNATRPMVFSLTDLSATSQVWARFQPTRDIRIVRLDLFTPSVLVGGTVSLTFTSDDGVAVGINHHAGVTQTTSGALATDFTGGKWINLNGDKGATSAGGYNSQLVIQVQDI